MARFIFIFTLVCLPCLAQPLPPAATNAIHHASVVTNAPQPTAVLVTTTPYSALIQRGTTPAGPWSDWTNAPGTDTIRTTTFYRARGLIQLQWEKSTGANGYMVIVWHPGTPGWWQCPVGDTNQLTVPLQFEGTNACVVYATDVFGDLSPFSNTACYLPPELRLAIEARTNSASPF